MYFACAVNSLLDTILALYCSIKVGPDVREKENAGLRVTADDSY